MKNAPRDIEAMRPQALATLKEMELSQELTQLEAIFRVTLVRTRLQKGQRRRE